MSRFLVQGTPKIVDVDRPAPLSVAASPGVGATMTVEFRLQEAGAWYAWDAGPVTAPTIRTVNSTIRQVRFSRTAGSTDCFGEML